ncbi:DUF4468 domain-containing protein [Mariniflexile aquimaris]|uniref:DUF4468 domain-containing protein n=1 Tax=Mariniflexile aquimaris TaxID=881009 RepID=A0ABW3BY61_9FLAO
MKKIILPLFLISSFLAKSQTSIEFPKDEKGHTIFKEIVESELDSTTLFSNAKNWIAKTFGSYKKVVQFEDDKDLKIILKGESDIPIRNIINSAGVEKDYLTFTITIECKDKRYRYIIDDIEIQHTLTVLGIDVKNSISTDEKLENIGAKKKKLDELNSIDISKLKKSEKENLLNDISNADNAYKTDLLIYEKEYNTFIQLIKSLKERMKINDDF